jgi:hypothetical protein
VLVVGKDGRKAAGRIEEDGSYTIHNAPPGPVEVAVVSRDPLVQTWATNLRESRERPTAKLFATSAPIDRRKWFPLPPKFEDPGMSGLTLTLTTGKNTFDVDLQP